MRAVVTGAAGFIGSHLVDRLLLDGHVVYAMDKYIKGVGEHVINKHYTSRLKLIKLNVANKKNVFDVFPKRTDWVFHLAGLSNIIPSIADPVSYHEVNVGGTVHVLEAARRAGVLKFIYAASSSCYGIPDKYPTPETARIAPVYPYALTKYLGEVYTLHWGGVYKLPVVSLRLFNVYGPRIRVSGEYGPVLSTFLAQKAGGKPYTIVGDGTQRRDFTYISDVVDAFITAAKSEVKNELFNVGSGGTYSINRLVKLLGGPFVFIPKRPGEPDCTFADISKIRKILGWKPKVSFEMGVKKVLNNIDHWKKAPVWTPKTIGKATKEWFRYLGKKSYTESNS